MTAKIPKPIKNLRRILEDDFEDTLDYQEFMDFLDQIQLISSISSQIAKQYFHYLSENNSDFKRETLLRHLQESYEDFRDEEEEEEEETDNEENKSKKKKNKHKNKLHTNARLVKYAMEQVTKQSSNNMKDKEWSMSKKLSIDKSENEDNDDEEEKDDNNDNDETETDEKQYIKK